MNKLYQLLNVSSDFQFNKLIESLNLDTNEMFELEMLSESYKSLEEKRQDLLSMMAGSADGNYEKIESQLNRKNNIRKLKEDIDASVSLDINDVRELNDLVNEIYKKCIDNKELAQMLYQIITKESNKQIADAFFEMVRNSNVSDSDLKIDTNANVNGQNVCQTIMNIKSSIMNLLNNAKETEKDEPIKESQEQVKLLRELTRGSSDISDLKKLIKYIEIAMGSAESTREMNDLESLKNIAKNKLDYSFDKALDETASNKPLKESYDSIINDLEDAQQVLYSIDRKNQYVEIINKYLKPYGKTIADLSWTGDFIDIVGEKNAEQAVDELYKINETASCGATCAANVSAIAKPIKLKKKKKSKISETMFCNLIKEGIDCVQKIDNDEYKFKNGYLFKNKGLVKTKNIDEMIEYVKGNLELEVLENMTPQSLDILLEDDLQQEPVTFEDMTPDERQKKKEQEQNLDNALQSSNNIDVSIEDEKDSTGNTIIDNQELVGVDDSDTNNKKYVVKNKENNKVQVLDADKIKMNGDNQ